MAFATQLGTFGVGAGAVIALGVYGLLRLLGLHELGTLLLQIGLLVLVFASAAPAGAQDSAALAQRISAVMDVGALLLGLALLVSWAFIVLPGRRARQHSQEVLS